MPHAIVWATDGSEHSPVRETYCDGDALIAVHIVQDPAPSLPGSPTLPPITTSVTHNLRPGAARPRLSSRADLALRMVAVVLLLAGAVIGFGKPVCPLPS